MILTFLFLVFWRILLVFLTSIRSLFTLTAFIFSFRYFSIHWTCLNFTFWGCIIFRFWVCRSWGWVRTWGFIESWPICDIGWSLKKLQKNNIYQQVFINKSYSAVSNRRACTAINLCVKIHPTFSYFILHFY